MPCSPWANSVDWDVLNCANYGDATTRRRFFLRARRGRRVSMPDQTHFQAAGKDIFGGRQQPWVPARDIIDWSNPGHSIFLDPADVKHHGLKIKRPLARNTLKRIEAGIRKFWGEWSESFLVMMYGNSDAHGIGNPISSVMTKSHIGLCQPFFVRYNNSHRGKTDGNNRIFTGNVPLSTIDTSNRFGLCQPFILGQHSGGSPRGVSTPAPTICTESRGISLVSPFIIKYYGMGTNAVPIDQPIGSITTDDRFGLVRPMVVNVKGEKYLLDILFRMLTPRELAAAHSFPNAYRFAGNKSEVVRQIGNSVPVKTATALCESALAA